jgi:methyl-accepting chemotaxis protein
MKKKYPYKRKMLNLSVNRRMQFQMIGKITGILFVCLLISSAFYFYYSNIEIGSSFKMFHIKARNFLDLLFPAVIFSFLLSLVMGIIASLFFPKTYAGALFRIEADLKKVICNSDLTVQINLRKGDQGLSLAEQVNTLLADFRNRVKGVHLALDKLEEMGHQGAIANTDDLQQVQNLLIEHFGKLKI